MAGSLYGANVYGKGLYSDIREQDFASASNVAVTTLGVLFRKRGFDVDTANTTVTSSAVVTRVRGFEGLSSVIIESDGALTRIGYQDFSGSATVAIIATADLQRLVGLSATALIEVYVEDNIYLGPYWVDKSCENPTWVTKECEDPTWTVVNATSDVWNRVNG